MDSYQRRRRNCGSSRPVLVELATAVTVVMR
jgi:hypothetical protein